ncbi:hypothetical protein [Hymenobacter terrenus]|uniref:hypothetical protein n=1 Tax=Hymenobacter terrenus TaxID=1629124 RepID=UPI000AB119F7|nr:hypothetical protein [Hymenobacter terrenus]
MLIAFHDDDSAAAANSKEFDSGSGSYGSVNGRRRNMIFPRSAQRAEIYRLRDSLLATGPANFSDTLRFLSAPTGPPLISSNRTRTNG